MGLRKELHSLAVKFYQDTMYASLTISLEILALNLHEYSNYTW